MECTKFCICHYWGYVSPRVWWASWPLAPRLVVRLQSLITPNHIQNSWQSLRLGLNSCDTRTICLQFGKNVSISNNGFVIWMLHINENLYVNSSSMLTFLNWEFIQQICMIPGGLFHHIYTVPVWSKYRWKFWMMNLRIFYWNIICQGLMILVQFRL